MLVPYLVAHRNAIGVICLTPLTVPIALVVFVVMLCMSERDQRRIYEEIFSDEDDE